MSDKELLQLFCEGDEKAFDEIYRRYNEYLFYIALKYVKSVDIAEDKVQEVWINLFAKIMKWREENCDPENKEVIDNLKAYLTRAVINKCLTYLDSQKRFVDLPDERSIESEVSESSEPEDLDLRAILEDAGVNKDKLQVYVEKLIEKAELTGTMAEVFRRRFDGLKNKKIAQHLGIGESNVASAYNNSKNKIQRLLFDKVSMKDQKTYLLYHRGKMNEIMRSNDEILSIVRNVQQTIFKNLENLL